jgi:hypothetical protein
VEHAFECLPYIQEIVKSALPRREPNQNIDIARFGHFPPRHRAKNTQAPDTSGQKSAFDGQNGRFEHSFITTNGQ